MTTAAHDSINLDGFREVGRRDDGMYLVIHLVGDGDDLLSALQRLVAELPPGAELSSVDIGPGECYHEARATPEGYEMKRGCHGSFGTWEPCSGEEAVQWLLPGLHAATGNPRLDPCALTIRRQSIDSPDGFER